MEPYTKVEKKGKKESRIKKWFTSLFCMKEDKPPVSELGKRSQRMSKSKIKQTIHMSLLGSYKSSTLCKISRKNFIVNTHELDNERLPSACSKHLGEKICSDTAVIVGSVSAKVSKHIPYVLRVVNPGDKIIGECFQSDIEQFKTTLNDLCIYRPKFQTSKTPCLLDQDRVISKKITYISKNYNNFVLILPKDTVLDEIGVILSGIDKFVQIQMIVANATSLCIIVYVGTKEFVGISQNEHMQFVVKELNKDLTKDDPNMLILVNKILQRSSIFNLLLFLRKAIQQAYIDTIFSCFLRNVMVQQILTYQQVIELFPSRSHEAELQHTPSLRMTARFNFTNSQNFKHSCSDQFLNGQNGELMFENQVETFAQTDITMVGMEIMGEYNPY